MDLRGMAVELVNGLDQRMSPSVYDAAWLLRLRDESGGVVHADLLPWLLEQQHTDGSWGSQIRYYHHDRILCTLAAAIAIAELPEQEETLSARRRSEDFLWRRTHRIFRDSAFEEPVGFELLFPGLLEEARRVGLDVPAHSYGMLALRDEKLALVPPAMRFDSSLSIVHSLEFMGPSAEPDDLDRAVFKNGSLGNSPAATAYYLQAHQRAGRRRPGQSADYIDRVRTKYRWPVYLYPFRRFESLWVHGALAMAGRSAAFLPDEMLDDLADALARQAGIALDDEFGIPDADCTAVACWLLVLAGRKVDPAALARFETPNEGVFRTYSFERNLSVSTNIHALEAVRLMPDYPGRERVMAAIVGMLFQSRTFNLFWTDKWHASPFYATAHALDALLYGADGIPPGCADSIDWLIRDQRPDGSWGYFDRGTAEETAYAVLALLAAYRFGAAPRDTLARGVDFLRQHGGLDDADHAYEPLWLGKCLYAPYDIVRAAVLAALIRYEKVTGDRVALPEAARFISEPVRGQPNAPAAKALSGAISGRSGNR